MNRISKQLLKIAREINALDEEGDGSGFQVFHDQENHEQEMLDKAQKQGKKYILHHKEGNLWRIQACKDLNTIISPALDIKKGDFGGLIQSEKNLSHDGGCWVLDGGRVYGNAKIYDDALIGNARIYGNAQIYDRAAVNGSWVRGDAKIHGMASVNDSLIYDRAQIYGMTTVRNNVKIYDDAKVYHLGKVIYISDNAKIHGNAIVTYNVKGQVITE